jgi:hypothetical protein
MKTRPTGDHRAGSRKELKQKQGVKHDASGRRVADISPDLISRKYGTSRVCDPERPGTIAAFAIWSIVSVPICGTEAQT